ncbi:MAG: DUF4012 domain-containing protein [Patescibacteria group bacterium]|nr:DUF4012 domain-containing protein [Patescibacteria group bacterium]
MNKKGVLKISTVLMVFTLVSILAGFLFFKFGGTEMINKKAIIVNSLSAFEKVIRFLPVEKDTKKEIKTVDKLMEAFMRQDNIERSYLVLLQNDMELRPGGGFLGQYAVVKVKNGEVISTFIEDANLLDERIHTRVASPYPFRRMMSIKKWKFRDSNFSPDFSENAEKAKYFYRLAGRSSNFDGVVSINSSVLDRVLGLTGSINVPGYGVYEAGSAVIKLEDQIERPYLINPELDTRNRKYVLKKMAPIIIDKLFTLGNIKKVADFGLEELRSKDVMLNFEDPELQKLVEEVHWGGSVAEKWSGDYLMLIDANMGALKSDYYMKRDIVYTVDLTAEKPTATLEYTYTHTATHGNWRTSDYHSYLRVYVPKGSNLLERKMVSYPNVQEEFNKTYFGFIAHTLIGRQTKAVIKYELPESVKDNYELLIQKQSGVGDIPVKIHIISHKGNFIQETILKKDARFELK